MKVKDQGEQRNEKLPSFTFTSNLHLTLKAWPVIALATIGLCYLTQTVVKWFGIELPDQANIELVKRYAGWNWNFAFLCLQIIVLLPALEELIFRYLLFEFPAKKLARFLRFTDSPDSLTAKPSITKFVAVFSSILFSAAHYLAQPFPDSAFLALFFFGLAPCWLYKKTGHLWCAILNHGLFNLTNLVLLFILPDA